MPDNIVVFLGLMSNVIWINVWINLITCSGEGHKHEAEDNHNG